jgi:hypothetical protein
MKSGLSFLVAARQCEIRELEQLMVTGTLVQATGRLVHALQKERGLTNVFLGSQGLRFGEARRQQRAECERTEAAARAAFDRLDTEGGRIGNGARLFSRIAYVLHGLDALPGLRQRADALALAPAEATRAYIQLISGLLAVVFEAADSATDPGISRLLVAMFNFQQGKEFAGQERAVGVGLFAAGRASADAQQQWLHLIDAQERCFRVFVDFATADLRGQWQASQAGAAMADLERLRRIGCTAPDGGPLDAGLSQPWFDACTVRIDAMQAVEAQLAADLLQLCEGRLAQARADLESHRRLLQLPSDGRMPEGAFFDFAHAPGTPGAPGTAPAMGAPAGGYGPQLERSVLELVQEQSQRLQAMGHELATVRASLDERKLVERAKGLLMAHRQLTEEEAHKMLRQTAMQQSRRLVDVAESVLAMADLLPDRTR